MGDFLSGVLGTDSQVDVAHNQNAYQAIGPWQNAATTLNQQLATQSAGGGPNPAQMQYLQNAQKIAQQQANTYSGNRALNPGLAARMAGNTGAGLQQQAASTAGIQQAQQQLDSQGLQANLLAQQEGATNQASGINAGVAAGNQQQAGAITGGVLNGIGTGLQAVFASKGGVIPHMDDGGLAMPAFNMPSVGSSFRAQTPGASLGTDYGLSPQYSPDSMSGQLASSMTPESVGVDPTKLGLDKLKGGNPFAGPASAVGKTISGVGQGLQGTDPMSTFNQFSRYMAQGGKLFKENKKLGQVPMQDRFSTGGDVPAMVSPGEGYLPPEDAEKVAQGKESPTKNAVKVPGKAHVPGDSEQNDTVPANLEEGGVVIPRSVFESDNPEEAAKTFVAQALAQHKKSPEGEFRNALKRAVSGRKNK